MSVDATPVSALVEEIAGFYVTDRAMRRAQQRMTRVLAAAQPPPPAEVARYLTAVERYFAGFEREARAHLGDVDRRLARAAQLQFNLTAERSVTTKRVELTQRVLAHARELARR